MGRLDDPNFAIEDKTARTLSYYSTSGILGVDEGIIEELLAKSTATGGGNIRLSLHSGSDDPFHQMIIVERPDAFYRPHLHPIKAESCQILRGRLAFFIFTDDGSIEHCALLGAGKTLIQRVNPGRWHTLIPLTDPVIYHEMKPGPFDRSTDRRYPDWAPDGSDPQAAADFTGMLRAEAAYQETQS